MKTITLITNTELLNIRKTLNLCHKLSNVGLKRIQIREKRLDKKELINFIKKIKENVEEDCKLFLNGNLKLATELKLDGCHMPENAEVNKIDLDQKIQLGRSIHQNTLNPNPNNIFNYFHVGPVFPTLTHPSQAPITEKKIINLTKNLDNIIFVGGINLKNVEKLFNYNFSGIAVMRELLLSNDANYTFLKLNEILNGKNKNNN